ncbi:MAG: hypothetical protein IT348_05890 [Candidatus Eisenbacteria bacterium]|nr:hypothetical protein [Candidatus Eisenbacteria bacterium]
MAEVVDDAMLDSRPLAKRGPAPKWKFFVDGRTWRLTKGEDFNQFDTARQMLSRATRKEGMTVRSSRDGDVLYVRAYKRTEPTR